MSEEMHVPSTDEVRDAYTWERCIRRGRDDSMDTRITRAEFDAWLAETIREAAARAWESGFDAPEPTNPYEEAQR